MDIPLNIVWSTILPAILLTAAATLLARAREIDLSLDQQCFFSASLQAAFLPHTGLVVGVLASATALGAFQALRHLLNQKFEAESMVSSIAAGMFYLGLGVSIVWAFGLPLFPAYQSNLDSALFGFLAMIALSVFWLLNRRSAASQQVLVALRPKVAGQPDVGPAVIFAILPGTIFTIAAATLLATYAGSVAPGFSSGIGILAATMALVTYGQLGRGILAGLVLGSVMGGFQEGIDVSGAVQSHLLPAITFLVIGGLALIWNRP